MAHRALIIAAQRYPNMTGGIANELPGTLQSALDFKAWLEQKWADEAIAETQILFCSEPAVAGGRSASFEDVTTTLRELRDAGRNTTEALYVFFSGHGFTFSAGVQGRTDYILTSDSKRPDLTPHCCLSFDGLVAWLRDHLGAGQHYYFVDACRNVLTAQQVVPSAFPIPSDQPGTGEPSTFVLQSTYQGTTASAGTAFPDTLLSGLRGSGKAKTYSDDVADAMVVHFGSLRDYVKEALPKQKSVGRNTGDVSEADAIITTIKPIPSYTCIVQVDDSSVTDSGTLFLRRGRHGAFEELPLALPATRLPLQPDRYGVKVVLDNAQVVPATVVGIDLFDENVPPLIFAKLPAGTIGGGLGAIPDDEGEAEAIPFGTRAATPRPAVWHGSQPHVAIAQQFPHSSDGVEFSQSLDGEVTDTSLELWLAILGGGRILAGSPGDYQAIARLPLHDFGNEEAGASPVYVLHGASRTNALEVSLSDNATPHWTIVQPVVGMIGISQRHFSTTPGPKLISFRVAGQPTRTVASLTTRNRATLVTLTIEDDEMHVGQYLLPLGHLVHQLPGELRGLVESRRNPLNDVRAMASAARSFRQRADIRHAMPPAMLEELFLAKWVDPIGSAFVAYQALRQGKIDKVREVAENMRRFFPELPDSAALATLAGIRTQRPEGVPLFLDGLRAYPNHAAWLPLPAGLLDYASSWTAWRDAV